MTKIIASGNLKGGTGKTMILANIAGELALKKRVLCIDADPQCNLTTNLGIDNTDLTRPSIKDIFEDRSIKAEKVILKSVIEQLPKLDLIPSNITLSETEMNLISRSNRERLLENWIKSNKETLEQYDYILCDTNPSMGLVNQNVFVVADAIILVTDVGVNGVQGAQQFTYLWEKKRLDMGIEDNVGALVINNVDKRIRLGAQQEEYVQDNEELAALFVQPGIPSRVAMKDTESEMQPICILLPDNSARDCIRLLVKNLKKKGVL